MKREEALLSLSLLISPLRAWCRGGLEGDREPGGLSAGVRTLDLVSSPAYQSLEGELRALIINFVELPEDSITIPVSRQKGA